MQQIVAARAALDNSSLALQAKADDLYPKTKNISAISALFRANADAIVSRWWNLHDEIVQEHGDGRNPKGYPGWWLRSVGFSNPVKATGVSSWDVSMVAEWLSERMKMPHVADAAQTNKIDGRIVTEFGKHEWKLLGATGLEPARLVAELKRLPPE